MSVTVREESLEDIWQKVLEEVSTKLSTVTFDVWIKTLRPVEVKGNTLVLSSPSLTSRNLVVKNYLPLLKSCLVQKHSGLLDIEVVVEDDSVILETSPSPHDLEKKTTIEKPKTVKEEDFVFNPKYTFDNFIIGGSNQFAVAAAKAVAENPGKQYNPLFIYGGVGLGKTHLLHAIGNYIRENKPELRVVYVTIEKFTNELIESIQANKKLAESDFRQKYRTADILIVDDIQYIINKTSTQEEFFHTFNELIQKGKQIVISSDKPPKEITPLEERLRSRFEWGLLSDIGFPDIETRIAILNKKAQIERFNVSRDVIEFIADSVQTNIREMEGLLARCVFFAGLIGKNLVNMETAKEALKNFIEDKNPEENHDTSKIIDGVVKYFNINKSMLFSKKRTKEVVEARQICMFLMCEQLKALPLSYIGALFGKDHSTVIYARTKISEELKTNKALKIQITDIKNLIKGN